MRRRQFLTLLGGAATALPSYAALAQQQFPLVGFLNSASPDTYRFNADSFREGLAKAGFVEGRNVRIETRWAGGKIDEARRYAGELIALAPDVILASGGDIVGPLLHVTQTVPIVFTQTPDPVAAGFVASLARPGGNATGFTQVEYGMAVKWVELLKEIAPSVTRARSAVWSCATR